MREDTCDEINKDVLKKIARKFSDKAMTMSFDISMSNPSFFEMYMTDFPEEKKEDEQKHKKSQRKRKCYICGNYDHPEYSAINQEMVEYEGKLPENSKKDKMVIRRACSQCASDLPEFWMAKQVKAWINHLRSKGVWHGDEPTDEDLEDSKRKSTDEKERVKV